MLFTSLTLRFGSHENPEWMWSLTMAVMCECILCLYRLSWVFQSNEMKRMENINEKKTKYNYIYTLTTRCDRFIQTFCWDCFGFQLDWFSFTKYYQTWRHTVSGWVCLCLCVHARWFVVFNSTKHKCAQLVLRIPTHTTHTAGSHDYAHKHEMMMHNDRYTSHSIALDRINSLRWT